MAILRNKTQSSFTVVNNAILKNKDLNLKTRGLLITMLSLPDNWDFSVKGLMAILPDGQRAITSGLKELEELGYLQRTRTKNEKGHFADVIWEICEEPRNIKEQKPQVQNADVVNDDVEYGDVEIAPQSNTNVFNTKELNNNQSNTHSNLFFPPQYKYQNLAINIEKIRKELRFNTAIDFLLQEENNELDAQIYSIYEELMISQKDYFKIGGENIPAENVKLRLKRIDYNDIRFIRENIESLTKPIKNMKNYIISSLYNSPVTIDAHYRNQVNVDFAK